MVLRSARAIPRLRVICARNEDGPATAGRSLRRVQTNSPRPSQPFRASLNPLAQFLGESLHLAHGHDAHPLTGEKFFNEHMPRIFRVRHGYR